MYLLDTNICIYIINRSPKQVVEHIKKLKPHQIKLSSISLGELEYSVSKSKDRTRNRQALVHFASAFDIIKFNDNDAEAIHALILKDAKEVGTGRMLIDGHISRITILKELRGQGLGAKIVWLPNQVWATDIT